MERNRQAFEVLKEVQLKSGGIEYWLVPAEGRLF